MELIQRKISRWANQCSQAAGNGAHDQREGRRTEKFSDVGQNVASLYGYGGNQIEKATEMVRLWYDEEVN